MDKEKRANIRLLILMSITAVLGGVHILFCGVQEVIFIVAYAFCMITSIPWIWFSYSLAKRHNQRHAYYHERDQVGGEPSEWGILRVKIEGWILYGVGLFLSFVPLILG